MASNHLPILPEVPVPRTGNVWAKLTNTEGRSVTIKLPDNVLWPPFYLIVGTSLYTFQTWDVPKDVNDRIDVDYLPTEATKVVDVTELVRAEAKGKAA